MIIIRCKDKKEEMRVETVFRKRKVKINYQKKGNLFIVDRSSEEEIKDILISWKEVWNTEILQTIPYFYEPEF